MPSGAEWFIVLAVVLVIFGGSQLPKLAKNLGKAQKEFKDGLAEGQADTPTSRRARADPATPRHRDHARDSVGRRPRRRPASAVASPVGARRASRRRLRMRRRSRSLQPPHTPWSMRCSRAYSRHGSDTGQPLQILRALSTPTPSLGKNVAGG